MTRDEIARALACKYLGKVISIPLADGRQVCGKVGRITCETAIHREPMAIFTVDHYRYEVDVNYFTENAEMLSKP